MITIAQLLEATEADLMKLAGEVLQPEKTNHVEHPCEFGQCLKCGEMYRIGTTCPYPDFICITPANAFKWRDWAVDNIESRVLRRAWFGIGRYLYPEADMPELKMTEGNWIRFACLAKILSEGKE